MIKEIFNQRKNNLIEQINIWLGSDQVSMQDKQALKKLLETLDQYTFENRLQLKGTLSHIIVDGLELDYALGEKIIRFDDVI